MTGYYIENYFPDNNIRFIAVGDNVDTINDDNDIAPFQNIMNDYHAKTTSKKVRDIRHSGAKQRYFLGSTPPYGYERSPFDKHKFIIDLYAAGIIRRIYKMYVTDNYSARKIGDVLNQEGVLPPQVYYYHKQGKENPYKGNSKSWCDSTILSILQREAYLGHMVQCKQAVKSYKNKNRIKLPPEMWKVVENTHDPIIDDKTWTSAQLKLKESKGNRQRKSKKANIEDVSLFSNVLKCMDCGKSMHLKTEERKTMDTHFFYRCQTYTQHSHKCTPHRISMAILKDVVLKDLKNNAVLAKEDEKAFIQNLRKEAGKEKTAALEQRKKELRKKEKRMKEIDLLLEQAFEKNCNGVLTDSMFIKLSAKYETEKMEMEQQIDELQLSITKEECKQWDIKEDIRYLKQLTEITELNRDIVLKLIESIHVSEQKKDAEGNKIYDIEITYRFQHSVSEV